VSRLIGWSAFITKVTFCNAFRSSRGVPEFKAKKKEIHDVEGAFVPRITIQPKTWRIQPRRRRTGPYEISPIG
jgi:hypothetical protein